MHAFSLMQTGGCWHFAECHAAVFDKLLLCAGLVVVSGIRKALAWTRGNHLRCWWHDYLCRSCPRGTVAYDQDASTYLWTYTCADCDPAAKRVILPPAAGGVQLTCSNWRRMKCGTNCRCCRWRRRPPAKRWGWRQTQLALFNALLLYALKSNDASIIKGSTTARAICAPPSATPARSRQAQIAELLPMWMAPPGRRAAGVDAPDRPNCAVAPPSDTQEIPFGLRLEEQTKIFDHDKATAELKDRPRDLRATITAGALSEGAPSTERQRIA